MKSTFVRLDMLCLLAIHFTFCVMLIVAFIRDWHWQRPGKLIRGETSWSKFYLTHALLLLLLFQVIGTTKAPDNWNWFPLLSIVDFLGVSYLAFFNGWFRNWLIGLFNKLEERPE